jgi:hypothetical protein
VHELAIGGDDVDAEDVLAAPAPAAAVPALAGLQEEAADADRLAVAIRPRDARNGASSIPPLTAGRAVATPVLASTSIWRMSPRSISSASSRTLQPAHE